MTLTSYAIGNAVVDARIQLAGTEFLDSRISRGASIRVTPQEARAIVANFDPSRVRITGGGSVANSTVAIAHCGGQALFCGPTAQDAFGAQFRVELDHAGVLRRGRVIDGESNGLSVVFIASDGERSMVTAPGVAAQFGPADLDLDTIKEAKWLLIEGYLLGHGAAADHAIEMAIRYAHTAGRAVALTAGSKELVRRCRADMLALLPQTDLFFANAEEALALTGGRDVDEAFRMLRDLVPNAVITRGEQGALVRLGATELAVASRPAEVVDTLGAGDAFAGVFLLGITNQLSAQVSAEQASIAASVVVGQSGGRLPRVARQQL